MAAGSHGKDSGYSMYLVLVSSYVTPYLDKREYSLPFPSPSHTNAPMQIPVNCTRVHRMKYVLWMKTVTPAVAAESAHK